MKKFLSLALVLLLTNFTTQLSAATLPKAEPNQPPSQTVSTSLTNRDVLDMLKAGLAPEIVVAKIKASPTDFDTSAAALQNLKTAGVPDAVIMAMVQAPSRGGGGTASGATSASTPSGELSEVKVPDGTEVEVQLVNNVSGQDAKLGDVVDFVVVRAVQVNGMTIIEKDASARGRITTAKKNGRWGKAGKLEWAMQDVQTVDGTRIPARFTKRDVGESKGGTVAVAAVATTVLLGPVGLLWGLKKGKAAVIPAGNRYSVFVHGDSTVKAKPATTTAQVSQ